eukprot:14482021-Heterocapsa_arctica.AAC.1
MREAQARRPLIYVLVDPDLPALPGLPGGLVGRRGDSERRPVPLRKRPRDAPLPDAGALGADVVRCARGRKGFDARVCGAGLRADLRAS